MLLWVTTQIRVDGLVPELFDAIPVLDLFALQNLAKLVRWFILSLISDKEVQLRVAKRIFLSNSSLL